MFMKRAIAGQCIPGNATPLTKSRTGTLVLLVLFGLVLAVTNAKADDSSSNSNSDSKWQANFDTENVEYDSEAFYKRMRKPDPLNNFIVYSPERHTHHLLPRDDSPGTASEETIVVRGPWESPESSSGELHERDAALADLDAPALPRRVIRELPGCASSPPIEILPLQLDNGAPFQITFRNLETTGVDLGNGPRFFAFWNASIVDIHNGESTTLTTVTDTPVETQGVGFNGCFETVKIGNVLTATLTQSGATVTLTPDLTGRYFVDVTVSPGLQSTRVGFKVTTTPYTFTPGPDYVPPPMTTPQGVVPTPTLRSCPDPGQVFDGSGRTPPSFTGVKRGQTLTVTLSNVKESIINSVKGAKSTTYEVRYKAGGLYYYSSTVSGSVFKTVTRTLVKGSTVTKRRTVTTQASNLRDGCISLLVDDRSWVIPADLSNGVRVLNMAGVVNDISFLGNIVMENFVTKVIPPYPTNKPLPPKPTVIPKTSCPAFSAVAYPSKATAGQTVTLQLYNVPATPIKLVSKGWSTVYQAKAAATIMSYGMAVTTIPTKTYTTTMAKPTCINMTAMLVVTGSAKVLPLTAAPSPTPIYQVHVVAQNYSDIPDKPLPAKWAKVTAEASLFLEMDSNVPGTKVAQRYPCLVGPVSVRTQITWNKKDPMAKFYSLTRKVVRLQRVNKRREVISSEGDGDEVGETIEEVIEDLSDVDEHELEHRLFSRGADLTINNNNLRTDEYIVTRLAIDMVGGKKIFFVAKDKVVSTQNMDLYVNNLGKLPMPTDWTVEWLAAGASLKGRKMPPFLVTTTYSAANTVWSGDAASRLNPSSQDPKPNIILTNTVTITPHWDKTTETGARRVYLDASTPMKGKQYQFQMTCCHPDAKKSAFSVSIFGRLKSGTLTAADLKGAAAKTTWTLNLMDSGSFVPSARPVIMPIYLGPISEVMQRFASDYGEGGRLGGKNPNADPASPPVKEIESDLKKNFKDVDVKK